MKRMKIACLVILGLMTGLVSYGQSAAAEQLTVPLSKPGKPYSLKIEVVTGSIKISGYDGNEIMITVIPGKEQEENDEGIKNGMKKISANGGFELTAKEADNVVTVGTSNPDKKIDLELKIPQDVKLKAGTVNGGDIEVTDVRGELEASNVNDKITMTNISGSVVANTVNGDVTVTFISIDSKAPMAFTTLNGDVNVTLPADSHSNLKLRSDRGDIYSDFDIQIEKTASNIQKTSENGMYQIKKEDWVHGTINGGGPEIIMKTMEGSVNLKKGSK
jgi:Putative adhesin